MDWESDFVHPRASRVDEQQPAFSAALALTGVPNEVRAPDFDLFRDALVSRFYPARVDRIGSDGFVSEPRLATVNLRHMTIGYARFGTEASVDPGDLLGYHVNVALSGHVASRCGDQEAIASPAVAAVFSPHRHTRLPHWGADAAQLCIKLDRRTVEQELGGLLGHPIGEPVQFRLGMPVLRGPGRRWLGLLANMLEFIEEAPTIGTSSRHLELMQRSLISCLLLSQEHSYTSDLTATEPSGGGAAVLDRVVNTILSAPEEPYSLADLSRLAGLSARSLQYAFADGFDMTPMQFVRQAKLDKAHEQLKSGAGPVADVAYRLGFSNLGRFARAYKDRFGVLPSVTLSGTRDT